MSLHVWFGFLLAAILVAITPGPGAVLSMSNGVRHGYWSALVGILGLQCALLLHLLVVALGLGAVLAASEAAYSVIKLLGAAYLIWLGVQKWQAPAQPVDMQTAAPRQRSFFLQGMLVNLTNPKAIVFVAALVPQFVDAGRPYWSQYAVMALTLCLTDMTVMSCYALAASRLGRWLRDPVAIRRQNRVFGGIFVGAGILLGLSSRTA